MSHGICPATREAVEEREDWGEFGCPICGEPSTAHEPETRKDGSSP